MSGWINWLTNLVETRAVSGFLYIGSDHPEALSGVGLSKLDRVIVANGNPDLEEVWAEHAAAVEHLRFEPLVIGAQDGRLPFYAMSLPGLSGISAPKDVLKIFPGLRETGSYEVAATPLKPLLSGLPRTAGRQTVLRVELNGAEAEILKQLSALPDGEAPDHVFLRLPAKGLYGAEIQYDLDAALEGTVYKLERRTDEDPDFPEVWLKIDTMQIALQRKDKALQEAKAKADAQNKALQEAKAKADAQNKALQEAKAKADAQDKAVADLRAQVQARDAALEKVRADLEEHEEHLKRSQEEQSEKAAALAQTQEDASSERAKREAALHKAEETLAEKMALAKQETDAALRLQTMARSDMRDLRNRYEAVRAERDAQSHLLEEVIRELNALLPDPNTLTVERTETKNAVRKRPGRSTSVMSTDKVASGSPEGTGSVTSEGRTSDMKPAKTKSAKAKPDA